MTRSWDYTPNGKFASSMQIHLPKIAASHQQTHSEIEINVLCNDVITAWPMCKCKEGYLQRNIIHSFNKHQIIISYVPDKHQWTN